jgi:uncharacterized protein
MAVSLDMKRSSATCYFAPAAAFAALLATVPAGAAINCSKPNKSGVEWLICSNDRVAAADQLMSAAFRDAFRRAPDKDALIKEQEDWRRNVRDACNDVPCLLRAFQQRTSELETY